jgi:hypothetical protein
VIDKRGGIIKVPDDICLELKIPEEVVNKPDFFNISTNLADQNQEQLPPLEDGYLFASPVIRCDPDGLEFKKPALLTIPFSATINSTDKLQIWCRTKSRGIVGIFCLPQTFFKSISDNDVDDALIHICQ